MLRCVLACVLRARVGCGVPLVALVLESVGTARNLCFGPVVRDARPGEVCVLFVVVWLLVAVVRVRLGRGCGGGDELSAVDVESEVDDEDELDCVW